LDNRLNLKELQTCTIPLLETRNGIAKDVLGGKGFIGNETLKEEFKAVDILPHAPLRSNRKDDRPAAVVKRLNNRRRLLETVIGQLAERFKIEKARARDLRHLTVRVGRKLPAHAINCFRHQAAGNPILQFERIFS
jgi:hypothetical protein